MLQDPTVSTNQLHLEQLDENRIQLRNLSAKVTIRLADGSLIEPGASFRHRLPARLQIGDTLVEIESRNPEESAVDPAALKNDPAAACGRLATARPWHAQLGNAPGSDELARWFEALVGVQRAAASSPDFFAETARAVVELIGLDSGLVFLRRDGRLGPLACYPPHDDVKTSVQPSGSSTPSSASGARSIHAGQFQSTTSSLLGVTAVVASPILNESQEVIGAVYGARRGAGRSPEIQTARGPVDPGPGRGRGCRAGAARKRGQAARRRVQFEQFFTPDLAAALDRDPALLDGSEREVTVLFADIRGFSAHL